MAIAVFLFKDSNVFLSFSVDGGNTAKTAV